MEFQMEFLNLKTKQKELLSTDSFDTCKESGENTEVSLILKENEII